MRQHEANDSNVTAAPPDEADRGLRQRKKQRTRERIAEVALGLFLERGFEHVTVADVARAAEVAQQTVFNYFPAKEDLVYWRLETFEDQLVATMDGRAAGESVSAAFRRFLLAQQGLLGDPEAAAYGRLVAINRMVAASPALQRRERDLFDRAAAALAARLALDRRSPLDDVEAYVIASSLVAVHRGLVGRVRRELLAGASRTQLTRTVRRYIDRACTLLDRGFSDYGRR